MVDSAAPSELQVRCQVLVHRAEFSLSPGLPAAACLSHWWRGRSLLTPICILLLEPSTHPIIRPTAHASHVPDPGAPSPRLPSRGRQ